MSELPNKLRQFGDGSVRGDLMYKSADEIERLKAENAKLRDAAKLMIDAQDYYGPMHYIKRDEAMAALRKAVKHE